LAFATTWAVVVGIMPAFFDARAERGFTKSTYTPSVMPALVAGIHVFFNPSRVKDVDGRDKPGHDEEISAG